MSRLEHPSIVQVSDFGSAADGTSYLVMEYLRGESLGKRLSTLRQRGSSMPLLLILQLCWQIADVLSMAHAQGVIHRDIKPENLMLVADPVAPGGERVKVLDFGIAKLTGDREPGTAKTDTHALMGTPMYMSPEQCSGAGRVDARTDVYALGCVLYQALAGRPPFEAEGAGELIGMHLFHTPTPLAELTSGIPTKVTDLVHRMLEKDKSQRPDMAATAAELWQLISWLSTGNAATASAEWSSRPATLRDTAPNNATTIGGTAAQVVPRKRRRQILIAISVGVLTLGVFVTGRISRHGDAHNASRNDQRMAPPVSLSDDLAAPTQAPPQPSQGDLRPVAHIYWRIETQPSDAFVIDPLGKVVGLTPWVHEQEAGTGQVRFRIKREGYLETEVFFDHAESASLSVTLQRKALPIGPRVQPPVGKAADKKREIGYEE